MDGFTLWMALFDFVPVAVFGACVIIIGLRFGSVLFFIGAALTLAAGLIKAGWKLIMGVKRRDIKWMNRVFVPMQSGGFLLMLLSVMINLRRINFPVLLGALTAMPQIVFFSLWFALMCFLFWYRKNRFDRYNAKTNWTAQIIHCLAQLSLLAGVCFC